MWLAEDAETNWNQLQALSTALQAAKEQIAASANLWLEKENLVNALDTAEKQIDQLSIKLEQAELQVRDSSQSSK